MLLEDLLVLHSVSNISPGASGTHIWTRMDTRFTYRGMFMNICTSLACIWLITLEGIDIVLWIRHCVIPPDTLTWPMPLVLWWNLGCWQLSYAVDCILFSWLYPMLSQLSSLLLDRMSSGLLWWPDFALSLQVWDQGLVGDVFWWFSKGLSRIH